MALYTNEVTVRFGGCATGIKPVAAAWRQPTQKTGAKLNTDSATVWKPETIIPLMRFAGVNRLRLVNGWSFFLENYSKPPIRAKATHVANIAALRTLRPRFGTMKLMDIDASLIEAHLRDRLKQRRLVHRKAGIAELGVIKASTVHQEFRVLRRIFSVAVRKGLCPVNPCTTVEFPVKV